MVIHTKIIVSLSNKLYLISELPTEKTEENNYIVLGIFQLLYDEENDIYYSKTIQKIMIKNESRVKNYTINVNTQNYISIHIGEILYFIHLNARSNIDIVSKLVLNSKNLQISRVISDKSCNCSIVLSYINSKLFLTKLYENKEKASIVKCILNNNTISNGEGEEEEEEEEEEENKEKQEFNYSEIEEKETERDESSKTKDKMNENITNTILNQKVEKYLDKLIINKIKAINDRRIEEIKKEYENKFEMIQRDIAEQEKENEQLEKYIQKMIEKIDELKTSKSEKDKTKEDEKENSNDNNIINKKKNCLYKNDIINFIQYNNLRQLAQLKMMNSLNLLNPENLLVNGQMNLNDPRLFQLLLQNRNSINQGNIFYKMKNNNKKYEMPLNNINFP